MQNQEKELILILEQLSKMSQRFTFILIFIKLFFSIIPLMN